LVVVNANARELFPIDGTAAGISIDANTMSPTILIRSHEHDEHENDDDDDDDVIPLTVEPLRERVRVRGMNSVAALLCDVM
jgi:hypothetical protein